MWGVCVEEVGERVLGGNPPVELRTFVAVLGGVGARREQHRHAVDMATLRRLKQGLCVRCMHTEKCTQMLSVSAAFPRPTLSKSDQTWKGSLKGARSLVRLPAFFPRHGSLSFSSQTAAKQSRHFKLTTAPGSDSPAGPQSRADHVLLCRLLSADMSIPPGFLSKTAAKPPRTPSEPLQGPYAIQGCSGAGLISKGLQLSPS